MESQFVVKVLNGPHQGAQMEIPQEGIVLGSDDACDLIIFDPLLAPQHLRIISQEEGSLTLVPLEGEVFLDGHLIKEDTLLQGPAQVITAGDTHFVAGSADQEWPEVVIPEKQHPSEEQLDVDLTAADSLETNETADETGADPKKKKIRLNILIGGGAIIIVGVGAFLGYAFIAKKQKASSQPAVLLTAADPKKPASFLEQIFSKKSSQTKANATQSPMVIPGKVTTLQWPPTPVEVRVTQELLKKVPGVVFSVNEDATRKQFNIWVRGEAATTAARRILDQASPPLNYQLIDLSQLEVSATTLAQLYGLSLQLRVEPEGIAFWSGYLKDDKKWNNFFPHISRDLPTIRDNRNDIVFGARLVPKLRGEIEKQGFPSGIHPVATDDGIRLEGFLPKEFKEKWQTWVMQLRTRYASLAFLSDQVSSEIRTDILLKEFFPSPVIGIAGSIMPWVSLADGTKLFPGAKLKKGYTLEVITADTLQLNGPDGPLKFSLSTLN